MGRYVAQVAQLLGKPLFSWQRYVVDVAFELDPLTHQLAYDDVTIVLPRQQGKTELILPVMTHRSTSFPVAQRIMYTTQTAAKAVEKWRDVHVKRLEASDLKEMFDTRLKTNMEAIIWKNGSYWFPGATTGKTGGTGDSLDLGVIDEFWSRKDNSTEVSMKPAMMTRPNKQLWRASMVPGLIRLKNHDPKYMRDQMTMGRERVRRGVNRGQAYFEWCAPPNSDPGLPETWRSCMPGLQCHGGLIPESTIRSDFETLELVDFCAEYLGWFPEDHVVKWVVIKQTTWLDLYDPESETVGGIALAVDVSPDRTWAAIGMVGRRSDGDWHVEVIEPGNDIDPTQKGMDWVEERLLQLVDKHKPIAVVIDPLSPAASLITQLTNKGIEVVTPNMPQIAATCGLFYDGTGQNADSREPGEGEPDPRRIRHLGQPILDKAVAAARTSQSPRHGSFFWLRVGPADITALVAVSLALHGYELKKPADYDVEDSIPDDYGQCQYCYACEIDGFLAHYPDCERPR